MEGHNGMEPIDEQLSQWFYESQNHDHLITPWERLRPSAQAWYTDSARRFLTRLGVALHPNWLQHTKEEITE
jgi:hypothetical protein